MSTKTDEPQDEFQVALKDPYVAGVLAFVLPGLGHFYQGRIGKAILYFLCIVSTFVMGVCLSSNSTFGSGRVVYISNRPRDVRYAYLAQVWVGLPAIGAAVQYMHDPTGEDPLWNGFMAPPVMRRSAQQTAGGLTGMGSDASAPTGDNIRKSMGHYFELGTLFTVVAGLLNVFAIFDACKGPLPPAEETTGNPSESESKNESENSNGNSTGTSGRNASKDEKEDKKKKKSGKDGKEEEKK